MAADNAGISNGVPAREAEWPGDLIAFKNYEHDVSHNELSFSMGVSPKPRDYRFRAGLADFAPKSGALGRSITQRRQPGDTPASPKSCLRAGLSLSRGMASARWLGVRKRHLHQVTSLAEAPSENFNCRNEKMPDGS